MAFLPPAAREPVSRREALDLAAILVVAAGLRLYAPDLSYFNVHTERDLYRSLEILRGVEFHLLGSEMQYGGRVLGPFLYWLLAPILAIRNSPVAVAIFIGLLNVGVVAGAWALARRFLGSAAAFWTAGIYALFPLEIAQLRFNWNPCVLPATMLLALAGTLLAAVERKAWALPLAALGWALGMQLHLSAIEALPPMIAVLAASRARLPWKAWAGTGVLLLVLFIPAIAAEFASDESNVSQVARADLAQREGGKRWRPNANAILNFGLHLHPEMNEQEVRIGFPALLTLTHLGPTWVGPRKMMVARAANALGNVQLLFWAAGAALMVWWIVDHRRHRATREGEEAEAARRRFLVALAILLWQAVPVFVLFFFNFHANAGPDRPSFVPIRYYLVTYPAPFLTAGLGVVALAHFVGRIARLAWAERGVFALAFALLGASFLLDVLYLQVLSRSGRFIVYNTPNVVPNLRSQLALRDLLLGEAKVDLKAYYERVHSQQLMAMPWGEASLDWLITQDSRSLTNPPPPPERRWLLHSPVVREAYFGFPAWNSPAPELPDGARELRRWTLGDKGMTLVEYERDPAAPLPENKEMRNPYYHGVPMLYLGPDAELRALARERVGEVRYGERREWFE